MNTINTQREGAFLHFPGTALLIASILVLVQIVIQPFAHADMTCPSGTTKYRIYTGATQSTTVEPLTWTSGNTSKTFTFLDGTQLAIGFTAGKPFGATLAPQSPTALNTPAIATNYTPNGNMLVTDNTPGNNSRGALLHSMNFN